MSVSLLDTNVLIALAWSSHIHHTSAHNWLSKNSKAGWATCPITQSGFIRVSSNQDMIAEALSPVQSIEILVEMTNRDDHVFWPCDIPFTRDSIPCDCLVGYRQVTDAYLLGLAIHHQGKFVTFDRAIASLVSRSDARRDSIEIIGV